MFSVVGQSNTDTGTKTGGAGEWDNGVKQQVNNKQTSDTLYING